MDDTPVGNLILSVLLSVAEFEREVNRERQREGISSARAKGIYIGRPMTYTNKNVGVQHAIELYREDKYKMNQITKISQSTIYRRIRELEVEK